MGLLATGVALLVGVWLDTPSLMLTLGLITIAGWLRRGAIGQLQRRQMDRLLGQATSPAIAQELWRQRDSLLERGSFPGRSLQVTVLFADVVDSRCCGAIHSSGNLALAQSGHGALCHCRDRERRHGEQIHRRWLSGCLRRSSPPGSSQSASQAMDCAAKLQNAVQELEQRLSQQGAPKLKLRIGLHSGEVIAGSMGSSERMEFAVIGDVVNVCARLEALEKERMPSNCQYCFRAKPWAYCQWLRGRTCCPGA